MQKKNIKICHITQSAGGVETYILEIIKNTNSNIHHIVICGDNGNLATNSKAAGASVVKVKMIREISVFNEVIVFIKILRVLKNIKPDIIHAHSGKGGFWGRISGLILNIPTVFSPNAFSYLGQFGVKRYFIMTLEKILRNKGTILISSSKSECYRAINDVGWNINHVFDKFPNSIVCSNYSCKQNDSDSINILSAGRLSYQKNPELFIEIVEKVLNQNHNIRFTWLGSGYAEEVNALFYDKIAHLIKGGRLRIKAWGTQEELQITLLDSDIYLSTSRYEGLPYVLLEAMNNCLPLVVSNVDGNRDVVEHGISGFLCNSFDEFIKSILTLATNENLRLSFGSKSKEILNNKFNLKNNIRHLENLYYKLSNR